ncbi:hypothetical protein [Bradyrhizobium sp. USDA 327]|uniref:hypothetical protein n=1 Tax=Bradyrhizobium sp. USDA 327 TaxID=3156308 RepID=UPI003517BC40
MKQYVGLDVSQKGENQEQQKPVPEDHTSVSKDEESGARGLQRDLQDRLQPAHDEPVSEPVSDSASHPEVPAGSRRFAACSRSALALRLWPSSDGCR